MIHVWKNFLILGISSISWCISPGSHLRIQITSQYLKKSKWFLGMPIGTRTSCLMKKPEIKIMWRCPFKATLKNSYWYLWTVPYYIIQFFYCVKTVVGISQNFAEFREIKFLAEISRNSYLYISRNFAKSIFYFAKFCISRNCGNPLSWPP